MSNPVPRDEIEAALKKKGFRLEPGDRDHRFYRFYHKGRKTVVKTMISTGTRYKEYSDSLFRLMLIGLRLDKVSQVRDLLRCPMSEEEYTQHLVAAKYLKP